MNNATMPRADRATHLKVVAVSLAASIVVLAVAVAARTMPSGTLQSAHDPIVKATKMVVTTSNDVTSIR
jgi:hypothetical protein